MYDHEQLHSTIRRLELEKKAIEARLKNLYAMRDAIDVQSSDKGAA